jgi:hypothetical protein
MAFISLLYFISPPVVHFKSTQVTVAFSYFLSFSNINEKYANFFAFAFNLNGLTLKLTKKENFPKLKCQKSHVLYPASPINVL